MVLRPDALRSRLLKLEEVISGLEGLAADRTQPRSPQMSQWALERGLQLGAEIALDIGNHILSAHFGISAESHEDIITQLHHQEVIDAKTSDSLRGLGASGTFSSTIASAPTARASNPSRRAPRPTSPGSRGLFASG